MGVSTNAMRSTFTLSDQRDRARSVAATAAIHLALGTALLAGLALKFDRKADDALKTFDVVPMASPPPPAPDRLEPTATDRPSLAGKQADPSPILAPPERLPRPKTIAAAPVAGTGSSSIVGAAASGSGAGAGGTGDGGGGGNGGGGIGTDAHMLGGYRGRVARQLLQPFAADHGYAHLVLTIADTGRVSACGVIQSSGSAAVDQAFCEIVGQSRWSPARDMAGRPISVEKRWTATWRK